MLSLCDIKRGGGVEVNRCMLILVTKKVHIRRVRGFEVFD